GRVAHLVAVLDDTASMSATLSENGTVGDAAIEELEKRMKLLGRRAVLSVITTGARPALLVGPAASWDESEERLKAWKPRATSHDPAAAWDLALQLAGDEGRLLFLTDRLPAEDAPLPKDFEVVSHGRPTANVSLTAPRWRFDPTTGRGTVSLRVYRVASSAAKVVLTGTAAGRTVFTRELDLAANGSTPIEFEVPGGLGRLTISATSGDDALSIDSTVTLVEPKRRAVHVAVSLPEGHAAIRPLQRAFEQLPDVETSPVETADLVVAPGGTLPEANPDLWWLGIGPLPPLNENAEPTDLAGPFVIDKRDPVTDGVTLDGVVWGGVQDAPLAATPLISAGRFPLLSRLDGTPTHAYLLNIDFARSNLADGPDWPILMANLINAVRDDRPGLRRWNYRSGETIAMRSPASAAGGATTLTLVGPEGERPVAGARTVEIAPPSVPGVYAIRDGETTLGSFAVNFQDDAESDLTTRRLGRHEPAENVVARGVTPDTMYSWPMLAAILCVLGAVIGDWYVLRPKWKS
ncbi:MAG: hypothetical protein M3552_17365, partial [Planctomycetota bacterium]|nr:hypothetical protein [Planctomycetota bacterium]